MNNSRVIVIAGDPIKRVIDDSYVITIVKSMGLNNFIIVDLKVIVSLEKYLDIVLPKSVTRLIVVISDSKVGAQSDVKSVIKKVRKDATITFLFSNKLKENIMIIFY